MAMEMVIRKQLEICNELRIHVHDMYMYDYTIIALWLHYDYTMIAL